MRVPVKYIPLLATAFVLVCLYASGCIAFDGFGSLRVVVDLFGGNAFLGVAAVGATFVIISGGIDLSVGSVVAFTTILIASLLAHGFSPFTAITLALFSGVVFGAFMGYLIAAFELPPFLVTLAGLFLFRGMGFMVHSESLPITHPFFLDTVTDKLAIPLNDRVSIPFTATCYIAVLIIGIFLAHYTRFGRAIYAIGGDEQSAGLMGLPVGRIKVLVYALSGLCSALAGVVHTFYMSSGDPASCVGMELDAIAAVVIGGTLLTGGVGFVAGTAMGVLILGLIQMLIEFKGDVNTWWTPIVVGFLLLVFILLQNVISAVSKRFVSRAANPASAKGLPKGQAA
ncbi:MAG TPA: galactofuranose ABC transporter, permease protein YjfF [Candidatus Angelobacter sp.]|nr:galactofuranose ABC transporter, permease protein YjfF [Candidatus Angelobacter sp.]